MTIQTGMPVGVEWSAGAQRLSHYILFHSGSTSTSSHIVTVENMPLVIQAFGLDNTAVLELDMVTQGPTGTAMYEPLKARTGEVIQLTRQRNVLPLPIEGQYRLRMVTGVLGTFHVIATPSKVPADLIQHWYRPERDVYVHCDDGTIDVTQNDLDVRLAVNTGTTLTALMANASAASLMAATLGASNAAMNALLLGFPAASGFPAFADAVQAESPTPPGGTSMQLQFNNAGTFGGIPGSSWNPGTAVLTMPNLKVGLNDVWHAGNDGAASTLDAGYLGGSHWSNFLQLGSFSDNKIFILATGQSNIANRVAGYAWNAPPNLEIWGFEGTDGFVATQYYAPDETAMNVAWATAAQIARMMPTHTVYLLYAGFGSQPISHWLPGTTAPDAYQNIINNIGPALAAAGMSKIDLMLWWQGESDAPTPANYPVDFEAVIDRFKTNSWFKVNTPIVVFGISSYELTGDTNYRRMNNYLQACVHNDPDNRIFVYPAAFNSSYWEAPANIHMNGAGYEMAGQMAANAVMGRAQRVVLPGVVINPETWATGIGGLWDPTQTLDVNGGLRAQASSTASSGEGVEIDYSPGSGGRIMAFDRTAVAWKKLTLNGTLNIDGAAAKAGILNASPTVAWDVAGGIRATGENAGATGAGIEIDYNAATGGRLVAYDRATALYKTLKVQNFATFDGVNGRLGIGTVPAHPLDVSGYIVVRNAGLLVMGTDGAYRAGFNSSADVGYMVLRNAAQTTTINLDATATSYFNGGNVVVGATAALSKLDLATGQFGFPAGTAAAPGVAVRTDLDTGLFQPSANVLAFSAGGAERMRVDGTGATIAAGLSLYVGATKVVGPRSTGWAAATGTPTRTTFATGSVTLPELAERVKALIDDLISHGLIGA